MTSTSIRWTRTALDLIVQQQLNPLRAARALAILHVAMHDALVRGVKQSGVGREGGEEGIDEYLATNYVAIDA